MKDNKLNTSIEFIKGVGKMRAEIIKEELGIKTCYDLLNLLYRMKLQVTYFWEE